MVGGRSKDSGDEGRDDIFILVERSEKSRVFVEI